MMLWLLWLSTVSAHGGCELGLRRLLLLLLKLLLLRWLRVWPAVMRQLFLLNETCAQEALVCGNGKVDGWEIANGQRDEA